MEILATIVAAAILGVLWARGSAKRKLMIKDMDEFQRRYPRDWEKFKKTGNWNHLDWF